jgi:uncharacterized integral membrane protein (TIGR00698 family)
MSGSDPSTATKPVHDLVEDECFVSLGENGAPSHPPTSSSVSRWAVLPGLLLAIAITGVATWIRQWPFPPFTLKGAALEHPLGISILAILLGLIVSTWIQLPKKITHGCKWVASWFIPIAIVLLGASVEVSMLDHLAGKLLITVFLIMAMAIGLGIGIGRLFGLSPNASYLLGIGTAVCGSSAVLAVAPVSKSTDDDVLIIVGAVNIIGLLAMFTCVASLWWTPLPTNIYGFWAGATIHAVPQVIAAGQSHSPEAATMATVVKLLRVSSLAPIVLISALWFARKTTTSLTTHKKAPWHASIPWFIWGFLLFALFRNLEWMPELSLKNGTSIPSYELCHKGSKWLLAISMAAIGLQVNLKTLIKHGSKALLAGILVWLIMSATALPLIYWAI